MAASRLTQKRTYYRRRVRKLSVPISPARLLVISLRRFRTRPERRSRQYRQLVAQGNLFSFREVAFAIQKRTRSRQPAGLRTALAPIALIVIGLNGAVFFGLHLSAPAKLDLIKPASAAALSKLPPQTESLKRSTPVRLQIPKIGIDTSLVAVGLQPSGAIAMPGGFDVAGWYDHGPTPGEIGPAVIVGHVDRVDGIAIFWRLRELKPSDKIKVVRADGSVARFNVTALRQFPQDKFPTKEVYGKINYAGLRLITCGGTFNTSTQHYSHNTVVYATLDN
jgi:hypothetical protein